MVSLLDPFLPSRVRLWISGLRKQLALDGMRLLAYVAPVRLQVLSVG